ncbi:MAG: DUF2807 domain-containing protein [Bacteroidota bacterium]|nr:DUF2807 domain-containing protein [Bacteroidota bacterium]
MRKVFAYMLLTGFMLAAGSCKKMAVDNCFSNTGEIISEVREVQDIHYVLLENNVNLVLIQDSVPSLRVEAGKNIIDKVITELSGSNLYIRNENDCNWLRSYAKEITVYLGVSKLDSLDYRSSGDLATDGTLMNDSIDIHVWEGSGSIDMDIDVKQSRINLHYGTVDMHISGISHVTYVFSGSYGPVYCDELDSKFTYVSNQGTNDCYVRASVALEVTIKYLGNIYYYGTPSFIKKDISGEGELIKLGDK